MITQKTFSLVLLTALAVFSQQITISGKVTDTSGVTPIAGAVVKLEKYGFADTTTADGIFALTGFVSNIGQGIHQLQPDALSATMRNGVLSLYVPERGAVTITTYTMQGRSVSIIRKVMERGAHNIAQPGPGRGIYLYRIQAGSRELVLKSAPFSRTEKALGMDTAPTATAGSAHRYVPIDDVIFASKEGLLHYRVAVTNSDTSNIEIIMIPNAGDVADADGNVYQSVQIGNQVWTVENWRSTKYTDSTAIPHVPDRAAWASLTTPGYCYYNNETHADTIKKWGALYNWHVVSPTNPKQIAPAGWRVPTDAEWTALQNHLIANGYNWDNTTTGNKIGKSMAAKADWITWVDAGTIGNDLRKNNASGFSALPGGFRYDNGNFISRGTSGHWWCTTQLNAPNAYNRRLSCNFENLYRNYNNKPYGHSVRFLRD